MLEFVLSCDCDPECSDPMCPCGCQGVSCRSCSGGSWLSMKIHLAVDGRGRPLSMLLTAGQAGDNPQLMALLDASTSLDLAGPQTPGRLIADKGYAHDSTRRALRQRGIRHVMPERSHQVAHRAAQAGDHRPSTR
ncbi:transposase [Micromonospora sp. U56]|uniref:transposase n=1 Tax=Micromonospora sp. U56 TaxID=2824900 RepID=UPI001FFC98AD|nr:transposase [Micromonospora sp. U56]